MFRFTTILTVSDYNADIIAHNETDVVKMVDCQQLSCQWER